jgi:hypothetical protein
VGCSACPGSMAGEMGYRTTHGPGGCRRSSAVLELELEPLPDVCAPVLDLRKAAKEKDRDQAGVARQRSQLFFTTRYGNPVEPRNFNRSWATCCARPGVRKITVQDARRTCATLLVDLDVHPRVIMQVLRHAEISVTPEIYSQAFSGATRDALKRLGRARDERCCCAEPTRAWDGSAGLATLRAVEDLRG